MKTYNYQKGVIFTAMLTLVIVSCTKDGYSPNPNGFLKKVKNGDFITKEISYNTFNLVSEVNSTSFWRKFYYNDENQLIKEEIAADPDMFSSSMSLGQSHDFVDPHKVGISMYSLYEYDNNGRLIRQLNYIPKDDQDELRSMNTFDYNGNNLIEKVFLHNGNGEITQFRTYQYDSNSNVIEQNYYSFLFIPSGTGPKLLSKISYEYDSFHNPYQVFQKSGQPGIYTNKNNVTKTKTINYDPAPGIPAVSESTTSYEYNFETGYPIRVINGEEFIYE